MTDPRPLPLFLWQEARQQRAARRRILRRRAALLAMGIAALGASLLAPPQPRLVWNASASAPLGLYRIWLGTMPRRNEMVLAWLPKDARDLAARRHYLPSHVPILKHLAGMPGDTICAFGRVVTRDGIVLAIRLDHDRAGRPLPAWQGCFRLGTGGYLLLNPAQDSFDGRYVGASDRREIVGKAVLLWAR